MKLNLEIIHSELAKRYTTKAHGIESRKLIFRRPLLYEPGTQMCPGELYILRGRDFPKNEPVPGTGIICVGDRIPSAWFTGDTQILFLQEDTNVITVFNETNHIFERFDQWNEQLRDELEKESDFDIRKILILGSQMLENPFSVAGQMLQTLFSVTFQVDSSGKPHFSILDRQPDHLPISYTEQIKQVCGLERSLTVPFLSSVDLKNQQSYCCNLFSMGYFVGCVSVSTFYRPFQDRDYPIADHFFAYFQKAFFKYLRDNTQAQTPAAVAMQKLLLREPMSPEEAALFRLDQDESWLFFKLKERKGRKYLPKDYMYGTLNALMPQNIYVSMFHKEIVGLIRLRQDDTQTLESFRALLDRMDYFAGLSNFFLETDRIYDYLLQAHYVVEHFADHPGEKTLYFFQDRTLDYLLNACTAEMAAQSLIARSILCLADHDKKKGTEYVKTLDIYLRNEMSITKTADALFIHRTSLMKRLDKIQRLMNDDLSDPDRRLYYRLCLALFHRM